MQELINTPCCCCCYRNLTRSTTVRTFGAMEFLASCHSCRDCSSFSGKSSRNHRIPFHQWSVESSRAPVTFMAATATQSGAAAAGQLGSAASGGWSTASLQLAAARHGWPGRNASAAACGSKETMATSEREDELYYLTGREHCCVALLSLSLSRDQ